jgi:hypothetical protein
MPSDWLLAVAWVCLCVCFVCTGVIGYDIVFGGRRQPMGVMNFVFPITALYLGPAALALYWRWGRVGPRPVRSPRPLTGARTPQMAMAATWEGVHERPGDGTGATGHGSADPAMPNSAAFWFLTQIGMMIGFATSWPANVWLVNRGIKVPM